MPENFDDLFGKAVAASIDRFVIGQPTARILVALSGGPDSTALLLAAHGFGSNSGRFVCEAAHVNHRLRGKDSEQDEQFCRQLCAYLKIPLTVHQDATHQDETHQDNSHRNYSATATSSEDALRQRRYAFLQNQALSGNFNAVLTAHTANDQAETLLFRLIRGTSLKGLGGIKECRNFVGDVLLLRPFLSISREHVNAFLSERKLSAREDLSNYQLHYSRNFIRKVILGPIEERFAGATERIADFAVKAAIDNQFIDHQAQAIFEQLELFRDHWELNKIKSLHPSLSTRIFVMALQAREIEVDSANIEALQMMLFADKGSRISLDGIWDAIVDSNHMQWLKKSNPDAVDALLEFEVAVKIPGLTPIANTGRKLNIEPLDIGGACIIEEYPAADALEALVDLSQIQKEFIEPITLRRRRPGDFIQPLGMSQTVKLKKYLHTKKASRLTSFLDAKLESGYVVSHCIILASGKEALWIPGIGLSEKVKVRENARPTHRLSIVDLPAETI